MNHEIYMLRCLELAEKGMRAAMPNPSVGAVLVHDGRIIGEGHTSPYGGPHGEVNCINSVSEANRHLIPHATLYVSLEPCSHYGKTPPCSDLIILQEIKKVVIGTTDPHEKVAGNGIKKLRDAGVEVIVGVLEYECRESNRRFFTFHEKKRPYIILKWAESADGFLSPHIKQSNISIAGLLDDSALQLSDEVENKKPIWITNKYSRQLVHKWRSEEAAILVGTQTVLDDNPSLDVRSWTGPDPIRIVIDRNGKISSSYSVKNQKNKTIILTEQANLPNLDMLQFENIPFDEGFLPAVMNVLHRHNLLSVIIEGGGQTLQSFINAELWDEARVFKGKVLFGNGTPAPLFNAIPHQKQMIAYDELLLFRNHSKCDTI